MSKSDSIVLDGNSLSRAQLVAVARNGSKVSLDPTGLKRVQRAADFLAEKVSCGEPTYGVTTGFGSNADKLLGAHRLRDELPGSRAHKPEGTLLEELQHNLITTHAVCVGKPFGEDVVRAMLLIRINTLMRGHSGIRVSTIEALTAMLNAGVVPVPGTIQPYSKAMIYARVSGYLKSWQQDIGAHVTAGQVLATIDSPDLDQQLDQARADFATAEANEKLAITTANRWQLMGASQSVARQAVDEKVGDAAAKKAIADSAQANLRRLEALAAFKSVVAPFDGVVTQRNTDVGALINAGSTAGQELFEVSDLHRVRLYVQVPQAYSAQLHPGLKATFELPQYSGTKFDATVTTTSNAMNATSRSLLVELQADNPDGKLMGGTYCQVTFQIPGNANTLRVPATALMPVNHGAQVAVLDAGNKVTLKTIRLGHDFGDSVEVTAGLTSQDKVIDSPPETLQSGDTVQLAAMQPAKGS